jgi:hypothetical protein
LVLTISACQSAQQPSQQQAQASGAAPSAQAPNVQSSGGLCDNPYIPVVEGATATYNLTTDKGTVTETDTITDVGTDAFLVETTQPDSNYVITWHCTPEGLYWLQSDGGTFAAVFQGDVGSQQWEVTSFDGITLPTDIQPGDTWTQSEEISISGTGATTYNIDLDFTAVGMESVTVTAGTFNAMRIDVIMVGATPQVSMTFTFSVWYAPGVGQVQLIGQNDIGQIWSLELVSYSIP